jgi:maltooligosyltrehalose trehalohydrolase
MPASRFLPIGAELLPDGGVHFRTWALGSKNVTVEQYVTDNPNPIRVIPLSAEEGGYFSGTWPDLKAGDLYKYRLVTGSFPDPASRYQPFGPHGPSQVVNPKAFSWTDNDWRGLPLRSLVIYELHLGTFTHEGTWTGAQEQLPELRRLGVTAVEVMPIADFPGEFGWGYDGVDLFAPCRLYGSPDDARHFINRAHELGMTVLLDVVYNHLGPDGNFLRPYSDAYFHPTQKSEWGDAINFDGADSAPVREFFLSNVRYWIGEYHFDGLRLDATQQIFDRSEPHILADIARVARIAGAGRSIVVIAEDGEQKARLARPVSSGGYSVDAVWNDDFHHAAMVAATGHTDGYYTDYKGSAQEFISALKHGFLYQGQWSLWMKNAFGTPAFDLKPWNFVNFLQNHDQVANSLRGARLHQIAAPGKYRALTAVTLLAPSIPLLFQGQEFSTSAPFIYFADHEPELSAKVREGRHAFLQQFRAIATERHPNLPADPSAQETFLRCKLDFSERARNYPVYKMHEDLLRLRRDDPTISTVTRIDGAVLNHDAFVIRFFSPTGDDRLLLVNLGTDLILTTAPEPLLSPIENHGWRVLWSSEEIQYGGGGTAPLEITTSCSIVGHAAVLLAPVENAKPQRIQSSEKD